MIVGIVSNFSMKTTGVVFRNMIAFDPCLKMSHDECSEIHIRQKRQRSEGGVRLDKGMVGVGREDRTVLDTAWMETNWRRPAQSVS
jgi:hypothetical protein